MITFLALAVAQNPLDQTVSIESGSVPLSSLARELGSQAGIEIVVRGAPEHDFVYVRVRDRSIRGTLDLLAWTCQATWRETGDSVVFSAPWPPDGRVERESRRRAVQKWLNENPIPEALTRESANKIIDGSILAGGRPSGSAVTQLSNSSPASRAQMRLIHEIGAEEIARIGIGESAYFTLGGGKLVKKLPKTAPRVFDDFVKEGLFYQTLLQSRGKHLEPNGMESGSSVHSHAITEFAELKDCLLEISNDYDQISSRITFFGGPQNQIEISHHRTITTYEMPESHAVEDDFAAMQEVLLPSEEWKMLMAHRDSTPEKPLPEQVVARLVNLDKDEVLTDYVDEPLRQLSESRKRDLAAIIPDGAFGMMVFAAFGGQHSGSIGDFLRRAYYTGGEVREQDGAMIVRPANLDEIRQARMPRRLLAELIRDGRKQGKLDVERVADLAAATSSDPGLAFSIGFAQMCVDDDRVLSTNMDLLRFCGRMPGYARKRAVEGEAVLEWSSLDKDGGEADLSPICRHL